MAQFDHPNVIRLEGVVTHSMLHLILYISVTKINNVQDYLLSETGITAPVFIPNGLCHHAHIHGAEVREREVCLERFGCSHVAYTISYSMLGLGYPSI